jgi:NitT/TauT family transport system substrate-binding protein
VELSNGQGADKVMTAVLSGQVDIGFAGPEASIYVYNEGREDYAVVFAQLTKRDGSFLVGRSPEPDFKWENLRGKTIIGGRKGGVPEMTLEFVLKKAWSNAERGSCGGYKHPVCGHGRCLHRR